MKKNIVVPTIPSFFQNRTCLMVIGLSLTILLSACGNSAAPQSPEPLSSPTEVVVTAASNPNTQVTVSGQEAGYGIQTVTPLPTLTSTATLVPTPTPTEIAASPTPQSVYYSTSYNCDNSSFIKDTSILDGTVLTPGETVIKTWRFRNTGSCNWDSDYSIVFTDGNEMGGADTEIGQTVDVNKKADISVELTAPDIEGTYIGYWRLEDQYGNAFGDTVYVEIVVQDATATPTATLTPTLTPTDTPTATLPPTATPASTSTLTATPVATNTLEPTATPTVLSNPPTATPTSMPTWTATPVATNTLEPTSTPTILPDTPTATQTSVPTDTIVPSPTNVPTNTPTTKPTDDDDSKDHS